MTENSKKTIPVLVSGALGKMGSEVVNTVLNSPDCELVAAIDINKQNNGKNISQLLNLKSSEVFVSNDLEGSLCSISQDYRNQNIKPVLVDFTHPDSVFDNTRSAIAYGISPIIGTTGLSSSQINDLSIFAQKAEVGCAIIPNFSVGMVLLQQAASVAAKFYDNIELIEMHHNQKADSPSGTCIKTAEMIEEYPKQYNKDLVKESDVKNVIICSSTSSTNPIPPVEVKNEVDHWSDEKLQCAEKKYTSAAKTFMEKAAIKFCNENSIRLSIILPTGLYGEGLLPDHMKHSPFSWLKVLIETGKPKHTKIPNDSISMIHLSDLAKLFLSAYENSDKSGRFYGVYKSLHWQEIYLECQKLLPSMVMPELLSENLIEPTKFNFSRRDSLGVKIRDFPTLLKQTVDWLKSHPFQ